MNAKIIDVHAHVPLDSSLVPYMVESARKNHVDKMFVSSLGRETWKPFPNEKEVADANEDTFALCEQYPDLFRGYVYLNPNLNWMEELEKWCRHRFFVGVKLWISLRDEAKDSNICIPLLKYAAKYNFPVLIHSFFRHGGTLPGELNPAEIARLGRSVPQVNIIMAHAGGNFEKSLRAIRDTKNIYTDISGGSPSKGITEYAIKTLGQRRVLFGSDAPCRTIQSQLAKVYFADISERQKELLLYKNAKRIFRHHDKSVNS